MSNTPKSGAVARRQFLSLAMVGAAGIALSSRSLSAFAESGPAPSASGATAGAYQERRVPRAGANIYVRDYPGQGPAYVLMHGFPDNLHIYDELAPLLAASGRRVVTFDFLGYGASDKPKGMTYSFVQQLADLTAVVDALELGPFVPVPHDASGPAAINYALNNPRRISSMVLLNTFYHESTTIHFPELITLFSEPQLHALAMSYLADPAKMQQLLQFQNKQFLVHANQAQRDVFNNVLQPSINANFASGSGPAFVQMTLDLRHGVAYNTTRVSELGGFSPPVFSYFGTQDPYLDGGVGIEFSKRFQHGSFAGLEAGHWPQVDLPEPLAKLMLTNA
jgi:haloalkane dehalogenase